MTDKLKKIVADKRGSETLEMVYSTMFFCFLILSTMLIIGYALKVNEVAYAAKRVARYVEVTGYVNQTELNIMKRELLPNHEELEANISVTAPRYISNSKKTIQLRDPFTVKVTAYYNVTLANPADGTPLDFRIPITVLVNGQSEIYWKT